MRICHLIDSALVSFNLKMNDFCCRSNFFIKKTFSVVIKIILICLVKGTVGLSLFSQDILEILGHIDMKFMQ